jgi:hypothetical protein
MAEFTEYLALVKSDSGHNQAIKKSLDVGLSGEARRYFSMAVTFGLLGKGKTSLPKDISNLPKKRIYRNNRGELVPGTGAP